MFKYESGRKAVNVKSKLRVAFNLMMASVVAVGSMPQAAFATQSVSQAQTVMDDTEATIEGDAVSIDNDDIVVSNETTEAQSNDDTAVQAETDAIAVAGLDTLGAVYVSGFKVREQTDGVGPFDADDEAGNDSSESNRIVRSFDSISYTLEYTTALTDTSRPADSAVLDATFTLPYSPKKAHFDDQTLNWMVDKKLTYVYADGSISETWDKEREVVSQVITGKRLLEGKSTDDRVPGAGQLSAGVVVVAAVQGETIQPTFSLVAEGTDRSMSCAGEVVTVSSKPRFNVAISQGSESKRSKVYVNWETGKVTLTDGGDSSLDQGYIHTDMVGFALWNTSADKGLKGLELPTGDIHLDLRLNATLDGEDVTTDSVWGSMLWDYCEAKSTTLGKLGRLVSFRAHAFPGWGAKLPYGRYGLQEDKLVNGTWQNGEWSLEVDDGDPTLLHVTITGCDIDYEDLTFPQAHTDYYGHTTSYFPANVGYISVGSVQTFSRFPRTVDATRTYHRQITCESIAVDTATAGTVTTQEKTTDDTVGNNVALYAPGSIVKYVFYGGNSSWNAGDSVRAAGQDITACSNVSYLGDDPIYAYDVLHKFDPAAFNLKSTKVTTWSVNDGEGEKSVWYAAKPDGSAWASDEEQRDTTFEQLVYYKSLEELEADGKTCVGVMLEARNGTFLAGRDMRLLTLTLTVRDDAQPGSVPITTNDVRVWRDSGNQGSVGDTACGAGFGQGDWSWEKKKANVPDGYTTPWSYMYETNKYEATKYQDGNIVGGHTTGCVYGDSCLIVGAKAEVNITIADVDSAGKARTCYDLDAGERTVTFHVAPIVKVQGSSTRPDGSGATGTAKVTVTIPSDLTYIAGSSTIEPESVTVNDDGTTTLVVDYDSVTAGETMDAFDIQCTIGAAGTDHDVENNQQLSASAKINCSLDQRKNTKANGNLADTSFVVVRLAAVAASKTVTPEEANLASSHTWTLNFGNSSQTGISGCVISDVMPYDGDAYGSSFGGAYRVRSITLDLSRAPRLLERLGDGAGVLSYTGDSAVRTQGIDAIVEGTSTAKFKSLTSPTVKDGKLTWSGLDLSDSALKAWKMELGDFYGNEYISVSIDVDTADDDGNRIVAADGGIQRAGDVYANGYAEFAEGQAAVVHSNTVKTTVKAQDITVTKAWEGDEGHERFRPASVKATVSGSDGSSRDVQLSAANNWTATLTELPYFDADGNKIEYSAAEPVTTDDYESTVTGSAEKGFTITNKWVYEATGSFRLTGTKNLTGREFEGGDTMAFHVEGSVEGDDGLTCPMPSGIDANGNLSVSASSGTKATLDFGTVSVDSAYEGKTLVYKVTETAAAGRNVSRDETVKTFKVKVSDPSHNHVLKFERSGDDVEFTNTFTPDPVTDSVSLSKKLTGRAWKVSDSFAVSITPMSSDSVSADEAKAAMSGVAGDLAFTAPQQGDTASISVGGFSFPRAGTYTYKVQETGADGHGVANDKRYLTLTFDVSQDAKTGNLSVKQSSKWSEGTADMFVNSYSATGTAVVSVTKKVTSAQSTYKGGDFNFQLKDERGNIIDTKSAKANQTVSFGSLSYTLADAGKTFTYTVHEVGEDGDGWTLAEDATVKVSVSDNGDGTLACKVDYGDRKSPTADSALFDNTYEATGSFRFTGEKLVSGREFEGGDVMVFHVEGSVEGDETLDCPMPSGTDKAGDITIKPTFGSTAALDFGSVDVNSAYEGKTLVYKVTEKSVSGRNLAKDESVKTVKVKVDDKGRVGKLMFTRSGDDVKFTNTFTPDPVTDSVSLSKKLTGRAWKVSDSFAVSITPMSSDSVSADEAKAAMSGVAGDLAFTAPQQGDTASISVGGFSFPRAGTYVYRVDETDQGTFFGVTNERRCLWVTFTVTQDAETGNLSVSQSLEWSDGGAAGDMFVNTYAATGEARISVTKTVNGGITVRTRDSFGFELIDADGEVISTTAAKAGETATFEAIKYKLGDAGKTFTYTIREKGEDGNGWTLDSDATVKVSVSDNGDGTLACKVDYGQRKAADSDAALFDNTYEATGEAELGVTKTVNGEKPAAGAVFSFLIEAATEGAPMPEKASAETRGGDASSFGKIAYTLADAGKTYEYTIREITPATTGWTMAEAVTAKVTVGADNGDGTLGECKVEYSAATADKASALFDNKYEQASGEFQLALVKTVNGEAPAKDKLFSFSAVAEGADADSAPALESVETDKDGGAAFAVAKLADKDEGKTYTYRIHETSPEQPGWRNAADVIATVEVSRRDADNKLAATVSYKADVKGGEAYAGAARFDNEFTPAEATVKVKKTVNGGELAYGESFSFTLTREGADGSETVKAGAPSGEAAFGALVFEEPGTYTYTLSEGDLAGDAWGKAADARLTFEVTAADGGHVLEAKLADAGDARVSGVGTAAAEVAMDNTYTSACEAALSLKKEVAGGTAATEGKSFSFELLDGETVVGTASAAAGETVSFAPLAYTNLQVGEHTYTIREAGEPGSGWTKAADVTAKVTVAMGDDMRQVEVASIEYSRAAEGGAAALFTNTYASAGTLEVNVAKTANGGAYETDREFELGLFEVDEEGEKTGDAVSTVEVKAGQSATLSGVKYDQSDDGQTYRYVVSETSKDGDGWTNACDQAVEVKVADNGDGTMTVTPDYGKDKDSLVFDNTYACTGELELNVSKTANGGTYETDREFELGLFEVDSKGEKTGDAIATTKVKAGETATLSGVFYDLDDAGKTVDYVVSEISEAGDGWTNACDQKVATTVTDNGDGTMAVEVAYPDGSDGLTFDNAYEAAGSAEIRVTKTVNGGTEEGKNEEFRFGLYAVDEDADAIDSVGVGVGQTASFGEIAYALADAGNTYEYVIKEVGHDTGAWEQAAPVKVSVSVEDDGDGTLSCKVAYSNEKDGAAWFDDKYTEPTEPEDSAIEKPEETAVVDETQAAPKDKATLQTGIDSLAIPAAIISIAGVGISVYMLIKRKSRE